MWSAARPEKYIRVNWFYSLKIFFNIIISRATYIMVKNYVNADSHAHYGGIIQEERRKERRNKVKPIFIKKINVKFM